MNDLLPDEKAPEPRKSTVAPDRREFFKLAISGALGASGMLTGSGVPRSKCPSRKLLNRMNRLRNAAPGKKAGQLAAERVRFG